MSRALLLAALAMFAMFAMFAGGCAIHRLEVPTPPPQIAARSQTRTLAVIPLIDARDRDERGDDADVFRYRGLEFEHTDLRSLDRPLGAAVAEVLARGLVASGSFARVVLLDGPPRAGEAELVLEGRVRRARGYVERPPSRDATRTATSPRQVLAEVWIDDLVVREVAAPGRVLARAELGWALYESRPMLPVPPDPWSVLGEALGVARRQLIELLAGADLSGAFAVPARTSLGPGPIPEAGTATAAARTSSAVVFARLRAAVPEGFRAEGPTTRAPEGWVLSAGRCRELRLVERQTHRFHRALGPYHPTVRVTACAPEARLRFDTRAEFPARYLGTGDDGSAYFVQAVGRSAWRRPLDDVAGFLALRPPRGRYVFELPER